MQTTLLSLVAQAVVSMTAPNTRDDKVGIVTFGFNVVVYYLHTTITKNNKKSLIFNNDFSCLVIECSDVCCLLIVA